MSWLEDIQVAISNIGGIGHLSDIYAETRKVRKPPHIESFDDSVRGCIEEHSSDSKKFKNKPKEKDIFFSVKGLGSGVWGLRTFEITTPFATDIELPEGHSEPDRIHQETYRILRDTKLARQIKMLHSNMCQICGERIEIGYNSYYSEAHHIKPLGKPHNGPDVPGNIIVLCPNHHVMLDYGIIKLNINKIQYHAKHQISNDYISYHNQTIAGSKQPLTSS